MNPKQFLLIGGAVLLLVGILGFVNVLGPTPDKSLFGEPWWFDKGENWAHSILGVVALLAGVALKDAQAQKWLVVVVGVVAVLVGLVGFFLEATPPNFLGANLENPADNILHLVVGAWALFAGLRKTEMHV